MKRKNRKKKRLRTFLANESASWAAPGHHVGARLASSTASHNTHQLLSNLAHTNDNSHVRIVTKELAWLGVQLRSANDSLAVNISELHRNVSQTSGFFLCA
jgi:arginine/lysine/ornithine decarboxylase